MSPCATRAEQICSLIDSAASSTARPAMTSARVTMRWALLPRMPLSMMAR